MARNVHKEDIFKVKLPSEAISEDNGLSFCGTPQLVLASRTDAAYYKNDRTAIAYKFDSIVVELEKGGVTIAAPGTAVTFPYQSDAVGFVIDWRQLEVAGILQQGCYRVKITWTLAGNTGFFYYGSYNLMEYSPFNARGTVRLFVVINGLVRKQGINYKDSGFAGTIRFKGTFGYMQPNYDTENIIYTDRVQENVRNEAIRTYELRSNYLFYCMTRLIDEEHLLAASQIYITDHNANNHVQDYYDFPVILSQETSPTFDYTDSVYAKITAIFNERVLVSESKYDGNIQGSDNVILSLPTAVNNPTPCADATVNVNSIEFDTVASGGVLNVPVKNTANETVGTIITSEVIVSDVEIEVETVNVGSIPSEHTLDIQLTDGTNPVVPDSVGLVGDMLKITVPSGGGGVDSDAQAFLDAAVITDATIVSAIDTLVKAMKTDGVWEKMVGIYPFVGGTSATHKWNLKQPLDYNNAYRLVFSGGWTHSANGALPNGTNAFAETSINALSKLEQNDVHLSYYSRTNVSANSAEIGNGGLYLIFSYSGSAFKAFNSAQAIRGSLFTPTTGLLIGSRLTSATEKYYHKGVLVDTLAQVSVTPANSTVHIGNTNGTANWSTKQCAFASVGYGLTDTEADNLEVAVQAFQTTLGRQV